MKICTVWGDMSSDKSSENYPTDLFCDACFNEMGQEKRIQGSSLGKKMTALMETHARTVEKLKKKSVRSKMARTHNKSLSRPCHEVGALRVDAFAIAHGTRATLQSSEHFTGTPAQTAAAQDVVACAGLCSLPWAARQHLST